MRVIVTGMFEHPEPAEHALGVQITLPNGDVFDLQANVDGTALTIMYQDGGLSVLPRSGNTIGLVAVPRRRKPCPTTKTDPTT